LPFNNEVHVLQVTLWKSMVTHLNSLVPQSGRLTLLSEGACTITQGVDCSAEA